MSDLGRAVGNLAAFAMLAAIIAIPLALWKLIEIIIWLCKHISIGIK